MGDSSDFTFVDPSIASIRVVSDINGVASGRKTGDGIIEPSWHCRLWMGGVLLSKYLERHVELGGATVLEFGCGLGLCSLVSFSLGAHLVVATDVFGAMPMLRMNCMNNISGALVTPTALSDTGKLVCMDGHSLISTETDSDEYICSVCDEEIEQGSHVSRCCDCNFDVCPACLLKIASGSFDGLPTWFKAHMNSVSSEKRSGLFTIGQEERSFVGCPVHWESSEDLRGLLENTLYKSLTASCSARVYLLAADVTYNSHSVLTFLRFLEKFIALWTSSQIPTLLMAHHIRSKGTALLLFEELKRIGWAFELYALSINSSTDDLAVEPVVDVWSVIDAVGTDETTEVNSESTEQQITTVLLIRAELSKMS